MFGPSSFDRVLLDPPCSGLGQRPRLTIAPVNLASFVTVQRKLFAEAVNCLKTGGRLVYSTCTVTADENTRMVEWALGQFPLQLEQPAIVLGQLTPQGTQEFSPVVHTMGFFVAVFTKLE